MTTGQRYDDMVPRGPGWLWRQVATSLPVGLHGVETETTEVQSWESEVAHLMVARLSAYVLADHLADKTVTVPLRGEPTSLWQWLKHRWGRDWVLRRWPVRYASHEVTIRFEAWAAYPETTIALPGGPPRYWETVTVDTPPDSPPRKRRYTPLRWAGQVDPLSGT